MGLLKKHLKPYLSGGFTGIIGNNGEQALLLILNDRDEKMGYPVDVSEDELKRISAVISTENNQPHPIQDFYNAIV